MGADDVGLELGTEEGLVDGAFDGGGDDAVRMMASVAKRRSSEFALSIWYRSLLSSTLNLNVAVSPGVIDPSSLLSVNLSSQPPRRPMSPIKIVRR